MAPPSPIAASDTDVFAVTDKGNEELKAAGTSLSAAELQVLVLVDGSATLAQIAQTVRNISRTEVEEILRKLFAKRLIITATKPTSDGLESGFFSIAVPAGFFSNPSPQSSSEADQGVSTLKHKGYYVRIALRPAAKREVKEGWHPTILVVDDDPDLQNLIRTFFALEGFIPRAAFKRDDIVIALRQAPAPDLVLLDVQLPDANGFDILAKMRLHPVLKNMPVVMLTAEATREAVLKGLQAGADGSITKPFQPDSLVTAVKAVLGLPGPPEKKLAPGMWTGDY